MKFIDFFAGIGGFRTGLEKAGHECVGFVEFDKFAVGSYTAMHLLTNEELFTLTTQDIHGVAIEVKEANKKGFRGRVGKQIANTLDTQCNQGIFVEIKDDKKVYAVWYEKYQCYIAIRKLTPKECFRLQAFTDEEFEKAQLINSNNQLYKQAGNSVTTSIVFEIGKRIK